MSKQSRALASVAALALLCQTVSAQGPSKSSKPAAVVNGETIPLEDVDAILKCRPQQYPKPSEAERYELQREALDMVIDDVLMRQFLRKNAPAASSSEVNRKLRELEASLKTKGQSIEDYCRETGQSEGQLRAAVVTMIQHNQFIAKHLTEDDVRRYYDENREFFDQVTVRVSHILLRLQHNVPPAQVSAARARMQAIREDIVSGKLDFATAAKRFSECASAPTGGDIGYFPRKGVVEESFASAAFALKPNEVSDVVQTGYGLHLIRLTERKSGVTSDFKKIEDQARGLAGEQMLMNLVERERQQAKIEIKLEEPKLVPTPARRSWFGNH
jgi:parvulin-like peptidyl-prolyl isomerase